MTSATLEIFETDHIVCEHCGSKVWELDPVGCMCEEAQTERFVGELEVDAVDSVDDIPMQFLGL